MIKKQMNGLISCNWNIRIFYLHSQNTQSNAVVGVLPKIVKWLYRQWFYILNIKYYILYHRTVLHWTLHDLLRLRALSLLFPLFFLPWITLIFEKYICAREAFMSMLVCLSWCPWNLHEQEQEESPQPSRVAFSVSNVNTM